MIILCVGCGAKYFLPQAKIPSSPTRVRCPQCTAVFTLNPSPQNVVAGREDGMVTSPAKSAKAPVDSSVATGSSPSKAPEPAPASPAADTRGDVPKPAAQASRKKSKGGKADDRARRLARVLVSDILCYNQEKRDQALVDGTLMTALGDEIKKSWELYKEKVGADVAKSTDYFKEALNEILADGQEVF